MLTTFFYYFLGQSQMRGEPSCLPRVKNRNKKEREDRRANAFKAMGQKGSRPVLVKLSCIPLVPLVHTCRDEGGDQPYPLASQRNPVILTMKARI